MHITESATSVAAIRTTEKKGGKDAAQQHELLAHRGGEAKDATKEIATTRRPADYLDNELRSKSTVEKGYQLMDANRRLRRPYQGRREVSARRRSTSVRAAWSASGLYQGSRPFIAGGRRPLQPPWATPSSASI